MTPAIEITNISYAYGRRPVLNDVSFTIQKGDFYIIIGPNGSGKTTLMKIMAGILKSQTGGLSLMNQPIGVYPRKDLAKSLAFVPQQLFEDLPFTVTEVVLMGRAPHQGVLGLENRKDIEIVRQALTFTGVHHLADRKLDQLSGGERQRVVIARAICQEPQVILLDEPTASLDLAHQIHIMDLMSELKNKKEVTVVMVSHDVNLAAMYGDRILLLKEGSILSMGTPHEVLSYQTLEEAYGCKLLVDNSPIGDFPRITQVPKRFLCLNSHERVRKDKR